MSYTPDAVAATLAFCEGNPWVLQLLGSLAWEEADESPIKRDDVERAAMRAQGQLDEWFFPRLLRGCSGPERELMIAMARHPEAQVPFAALSEQLPAADAKHLVSVAVQLARRDLAVINAGTRVRIEQDTVSFTVPRLSDYLARNEFLVSSAGVDAY